MYFIEINGEEFKGVGISTFDGDFHTLIRPYSKTLEDIKAAVEKGPGHVVVRNENHAVEFEFFGYSKFKKINVDYTYNYGPDDEDVAINIVLTQEKVTANDITDIQLALAELAEMTGGSTW
jgi:hypothetical protein